MSYVPELLLDKLFEYRDTIIGCVSAFRFTWVLKYFKKNKKSCIFFDFDREN